MSEFNKWLGPDKCPVEVSCERSYKGSEEFDCEACIELLKYGWRAALEWALTNKKPIKYKDYKFDYIKTDVINEELDAKI